MGERRCVLLGVGPQFVARMAELADALDSGSSGRKVVEVRVLFRALNKLAVHRKMSQTPAKPGFFAAREVAIGDSLVGTSGELTSAGQSLHNVLLVGIADDACGIRFVFRVPWKLVLRRV